MKVNDEYYHIGTGGGPHMATIEVPSDAAEGTVGLRIRLCYNQTPEPRGTTQFGEVEDYVLLVQEDAGSVYVTDPVLLYAVQQYTVEPWAFSIWIGGDLSPGHAVEDIDLSAPTTINDTLVAATVALDTHDDIEGQALKATISGRAFLAAYAPTWDSASHPFAIGGSFTDGDSYIVHGEIVI